MRYLNGKDGANRIRFPWGTVELPPCREPWSRLELKALACALGRSESEVKWSLQDRHASVEPVEGSRAPHTDAELRMLPFRILADLGYPNAVVREAVLRDIAHHVRPTPMPADDADDADDDGA